MMKHSKLLVLLILVCLLMLPVCVSADTQQEFELRCNKKTTTGAPVYNSINYDHVQTDYIPAGTYVQVTSSISGSDWRYFTYMVNGVKKKDGHRSN